MCLLISQHRYEKGFNDDDLIYKVNQTKEEGDQY